MVMMLRRLALVPALLLLSACAFDASDEDADRDDEVSEESEQAITAGPTWKMVTLVFKNIDAGYTANGHFYRVRSTMSAAKIEKAKEQAASVKSLFGTYNNGRAAASMEVIVVNETLDHLSPVNGDAGKNGWWVSPSDIAAQLDKYAPKGRYDSAFILFDPSAGDPDVPFPVGWGRGPGDDTNGMTFGTLRYDVGAEAYVHEWLHGAGAFYRGKGFDVPDPHENRDFGHTGPNAANSWGNWYIDLMRGYTLRGGKIVGYTSPVWRSGTPTRWVGGSYPAPAKAGLSKPTILEAKAGGDWVYLSWKPVRRPTHYTEILTIRKPDGSHGKSVSKFVKPGIDRGAFDYDYFTKAQVCAAARESGVSLSSVKIGFQLWPDKNVGAASNVNVEGSFDCR